MASDLSDLQPLCLPGTVRASRVRRQVRETVRGSTLRGSFTFLLRLSYNRGVFPERCKLYTFLRAVSRVTAARRDRWAVTPGLLGWEVEPSLAQHVGTKPVVVRFLWFFWFALGFGF